MKIKNIKLAPLISLILGCVLILCAAGILVYDKITVEISANNMQEILEKAESKMPTIVDQYPDERGNNIMPSAEINGVNVIGILEVPLYGVKLPVCANWSAKTVSSIPCRFLGSIYDRTLIIGADEGKTQFNCAETIQIGDNIYITDMEGGRYTYVVTDIDRSSSADREVLQSKDADLTIFVNNSLSMQYILIRCNLK